MKLHEFGWTEILALEDTNKVHDDFLNIFSKYYNESFLKLKSILSPWITKGILKSSKRKQRLYEKFLKNRTPKNETRNKEHKNLFERIKRKSKKYCYSKQIVKYKDNIKKTWEIIKIIGVTKIINKNFPEKLIVNALKKHS